MLRKRFFAAPTAAMLALALGLAGAAVASPAAATEVAATAPALTAVTDTDVTDADVTDTGVTGADVTETAVTDTGVTGADVTGAVVTNTGVTGADVTGADVTGAVVTDTDVTGAVVTDTDVTGAGVPPAGGASVVDVSAGTAAAAVQVSAKSVAGVSYGGEEGCDDSTEVASGAETTEGPAEFEYEWDGVGGFTVTVTDEGCSTGATLNVSSYTLDKSVLNESTTFGESNEFSYPQTLFQHGEDIKLPPTTERLEEGEFFSRSVDVPKCGDYQADLYTGPKLQTVDVGGHHSGDNTFLAGGIVLQKECVKPTEPVVVQAECAVSTVGLFTGDEIAAFITLLGQPVGILSVEVVRVVDDIEVIELLDLADLAPGDYRVIATPDLNYKIQAEGWAVGESGDAVYEFEIDATECVEELALITPEVTPASCEQMDSKLAGNTIGGSVDLSPLPVGIDSTVYAVTDDGLAEVLPDPGNLAPGDYQVIAVPDSDDQTLVASPGWRLEDGAAVYEFTISKIKCEADVQLVTLPLPDLPTLAVTGANDSAGIVGLVALLLTLTGLGMVVARRRVEV